MQKENKYVLVVESDEHVGKLLLKTVGDALKRTASFPHLEVQLAYELTEANLFFDTHRSDIVAIIVCYVMRYQTPSSTISFVKKVKQMDWRGALIGMSSDPDYLEALMDAGCSRELSTLKKVSAPEQLIKALEALHASGFPLGGPGT
jgi:hypothetical protein